MLKDYYESLGILRDAAPGEIKSAYRRRALACHPDRGGTHAAMLEINEAFEILSDPEKRKIYDRALADRLDGDASNNVAEWTEQAKRNAPNYPRQWSDFQNWMNAFTEDFRRATYSRTKDSVPMPTAGDSVGGWVFIGGGVLAGYFLFTLFGNSVSGSWPGRILVICVMGGAWLGRWLHEAVGHSIHGSPTSGNDPNVLRQSIQSRIPADKIPQVVECLRNGQKMVAIKICREETSLSLAEVLVEIEKLEKTQFS